MPTNKNGKSDLVPSDLSDSDKIELIMNGLGELQGQVETFTETISEKFEELSERINNMSLPGKSLEDYFRDDES